MLKKILIQVHMWTCMNRVFWVFSPSVICGVRSWRQHLGAYHCEHEWLKCGGCTPWSAMWQGDKTRRENVQKHGCETGTEGKKQAVK